MTAALWVVLGVCAVATVTDVRSRRIPNALSIALFVVGVGLAATHGWVAALVAVALSFVVLMLGFGAFSAGWLGGGDVKLLAAAAAALGYPDTIDFLIYTSLAGGVLAILVALLTGRLVAVTRAVVLALRPFAYKGTVAIQPKSSFALPYAIAITCGAVVVALSHTAAPYLRLPL